MYNIVFCCDDNYIIPAQISILSLLESNRDLADRFVFYTFKYGLSEANFNRFSSLIHSYGSELNGISLIPDFLNTIRKIPTLDYISETTFYRLLLPYVLTDVDVCLFIDSDTLTRGKITGIWETEYKNWCISAVEDHGADNFAKDLNINKYCNAGILLMNLKKIRSIFSYDDFIKKIEYVYNNYDLKMADQDLINIIFQNQINLLPDIYNFQDHLNWKMRAEYGERLNEIIIIHFITGKKPWKGDYFYYFFSEYYRYLKRFMTMQTMVVFWLKRCISFFRSGIKRIKKKKYQI